MPMFEATNGSLKSVPEASLVTGGVKERQDLQQWLRAAPEALGEDLFVVSEEFNNWEDSKRRIDLLALDKDANLVVIEIKRTDDGGHMDLQAIRYTAMVSAMSFDDVVHAHEEYLARVDSTKKETARSRILEFLEITGAETAAISTVPRILLVSRDFSKEITTLALNTFAGRAAASSGRASGTTSISVCAKGTEPHDRRWSRSVLISTAGWDERIESQRMHAKCWGWFFSPACRATLR